MRITTIKQEPDKNVIKKPIFFLVGPSASGKSTLIHNAKDDINFGEIISTTTREPRIGEQDGIDYHFTNTENFKSLNMLETDEYAGNLYGTSLESVKSSLDSRYGALTAMTLEGAEQIRDVVRKNNLPYMIKTVFINTPKEELKARMINRGDSIENVEKRMKNIDERNEYKNKYYTDYIYNPIINNVEKDIISFEKFILDKTKEIYLSQMIDKYMAEKHIDKEGLLYEIRNSVDYMPSNRASRDRLESIFENAHIPADVIYYLEENSPFHMIGFDLSKNQEIIEDVIVSQKQSKDYHSMNLWNVARNPALSTRQQSFLTDMAIKHKDNFTVGNLLKNINLNQYNINRIFENIPPKFVDKSQINKTYLANKNIVNLIQNIPDNIYSQEKKDEFMNEINKSNERLNDNKNKEEKYNTAYKDLINDVVANIKADIFLKRSFEDGTLKCTDARFFNEPYGYNGYIDVTSNGKQEKIDTSNLRISFEYKDECLDYEIYDIKMPKNLSEAPEKYFLFDNNCERLKNDIAKYLTDKKYEIDKGYYRVPEKDCQKIIDELNDSYHLSESIVTKEYDNSDIGKISSYVNNKFDEINFTLKENTAPQIDSHDVFEMEDK